VINDPNNRRGDRGNCTTNGQDIRHWSMAPLSFGCRNFLRLG
jgi:hypothetical protein